VTPEISQVTAPDMADTDMAAKEQA
jgi:hypothetical protein